jgi:hypothetical protein
MNWAKTSLIRTAGLFANLAGTTSLEAPRHDAPAARGHLKAERDTEAT